MPIENETQAIAAVRPYTAMGDGRIVNAVKVLEEAANSIPDSNPRVTMKTNPRNNFVFVEVICTFKFAL